MKDKDGKIWEPWKSKKKQKAYVRFRKVKTDRAHEEYKDSRKELKKELNEYFASVVMKEKDIVAGESKEGYVDILGHVNKNEVLGDLKSMMVDKCLGLDGIGPRMLREAGEEIIGD
eukprot:g35797.t1